jgi:hypothetical protein
MHQGVSIRRTPGAICGFYPPTPTHIGGNDNHVIPDHGAGEYSQFVKEIAVGSLPEIYKIGRT